MASATYPVASPPETGRSAKVWPLEPGDRLDQPTFHARYEAMPPGFRAELVGGFVVVPSPLSIDHAHHHLHVCTWLGVYQSVTHGVLPLDAATVILAADSEPQPDACLTLEPSLGGQTRPEGKYLVGAPELIVEISISSEAYDLSLKFQAYQAAGVREYVVVVLRDRQVRWFVHDGKQLLPRSPEPDGFYKSVQFPGLWLNAEALLTGEMAGVLAALQQGLASAEHAAFVAGLQAKRAAAGSSPS